MFRVPCFVTVAVTVTAAPQVFPRPFPEFPDGLFFLGRDRERTLSNPPSRPSSPHETQILLSPLPDPGDNASVAVHVGVKNRERSMKTTILGLVLTAGFTIAPLGREIVGLFTRRLENA